jgi:hypothetical protein
MEGTTPEAGIRCSKCRRTFPPGSEVWCIIRVENYSVLDRHGKVIDRGKKQIILPWCDKCWFVRKHQPLERLAKHQSLERLAK